MLSRTFQHLSGVGPKTERRFWQNGVCTWDDFLRDPARAPLKGNRLASALSSVAEARKRLTKGDAPYFRGLLPNREAWRYYEAFEDTCAYVDIETTGLTECDHLTVVGIYDGSEVKTFIQGRNLDDLPRELSRYGLIVTYNGATFDLPFIERFYPMTFRKSLHIDLRYPLARLGYGGGLKVAEKLLGVKRDPRTAGLDGWDAVRLWREYLRGRNNSLDLLVLYNAEDIVNLKPLARFVYDELSRETLGVVGP